MSEIRNCYIERCRNLNWHKKTCRNLAFHRGCADKKLNDPIFAYLCKWIGVFPITKGIISPAAPSLVVSGVNLSAITVTLTVGSLSRMHTAEESPIMPPPTTATDAMFY